MKGEAVVEERSMHGAQSEHGSKAKSVTKQIAIFLAVHPSDMITASIFIKAFEGFGVDSRTE